METNKELIKVIVLKNNSVAMEEIENVRIIKIKDKKYNLLIMRDYWPILGEIDGTVHIEAETNIDFTNLKGFYCLSHNIFHLIIREIGEPS